MSDQATSRRRAAALRYVSGEMAAPEVVAAGEGAVADRILALAREHGIPVHEHRELAALLTRLPSGSAVPPELYRAVAEVIAFLFRTDAQARTRPPTSR